MARLEDLLRVSGFDEVDPSLVREIEAIIFASDDAVSMKKIQETFPERSRDELEMAVAALFALHEDSGIRMVRSRGGYRFLTAPEAGERVARYLQARPIKLGRAALETLTIVAYEQPVTRQEIQEIRGTDPDSSLKLLLEKGLIKIVGRRSEPGRPYLYGTTDRFLEVFGLADISELPPLEEEHGAPGEERISLPPELLEGEQYAQYREALEKFEEALRTAEAKGIEVLELEKRVLQTMRGDEDDGKEAGEAAEVPGQVRGGVEEKE